MRRRVHGGGFEVSGLRQHFALRVDQHGPERVVAGLQSLRGERDAPPQMGDVARICRHVLSSGRLGGPWPPSDGGTRARRGGRSDLSASMICTAGEPAGQTHTALAHFSIQKDIDAGIVALALQARAINPGIRFYLSMWSAPAWMKTNGRRTG